MSRTLVTSALPYANGYIHLGHCAGAYLPADIYVRLQRLSGTKVLYVCGSDEHGVAITIAAEKEGIKPKNIIDKYHEDNKEAFRKFGISFDIYSRTSIEEHHKTAKEFFTDFLQKGILIEKEEEQFYDTKAKMFLPDRYVEGTCPNCEYDKARGDQCDNCGAYYNQLELKNPRSLISNETPQVKKTIHWYFRFQEYQEFLENYIEGHSKDWKENVLQQTRSWLKQGLTERAITRDMTWGVSISDIRGIDKDKAGGKVLYVWFDAVLGYISATKEYYKDRETRDSWKKWWQSKDTRYLAFIGKDNIVFHTLIFPALLHARDDGYILPDNVPANEFLNLEGQKFSKSRNWSIDLRDFLRDFPEEHNIDALRYTLAMNFPESKDADFTWKDFQARTNNELSAILGNFVNRVLLFINKNFGGKIPQLSDNYKQIISNWNNLADYLSSRTDVKPEIAIAEIPDKLKEGFATNELNVITSLWKGVTQSRLLYDRFRFRDAISETMNVCRAANKFFNDEEPWHSFKSDANACAKTLYICCQLVHSLAVLFAPVLPYTAQRMHRLLNLAPLNGNKGISYDNNFWELAAYPSLEPGHKLYKPFLLFSRIEDEVIKMQMERLGDKGKPQEEPDGLITIDEFANAKLRTAVIKEAEKVKKSKKLLRLVVDTGSGERQIVAGIAQHYTPEELVGKTVVIVANLKPAKLMGIESQGMLLAANSPDGSLCLVTPEKDTEPGEEVR